MQFKGFCVDFTAARCSLVSLWWLDISRFISWMFCVNPDVHFDGVCLSCPLSSFALAPSVALSALFTPCFFCSMSTVRLQLLLGSVEADRQYVQPQGDKKLAADQQTWMEMSRYFLPFSFSHLFLAPTDNWILTNNEGQPNLTIRADQLNTVCLTSHHSHFCSLFPS